MREREQEREGKRERERETNTGNPGVIKGNFASCQNVKPGIMKYEGQ